MGLDKEEVENKMTARSKKDLKFIQDMKYPVGRMSNKIEMSEMPAP